MLPIIPRTSRINNKKKKKKHTRKEGKKPEKIGFPNPKNDNKGNQSRTNIYLLSSLIGEISQQQKKKIKKRTRSEEK